MSKLLLLLALIVFVLKHDLVDSACCGPPCHWGNKDYCNDCTRRTPFCGYRSCNFFGCNCECRTGRGCSNCRRKRAIGEDHEVSNATNAIQAKRDSDKQLDNMFAEFDTNKNGVLEFSEAQEWGLKHHAISKREAHKVMAEFLKIDSDKDGKLARHEIDK